MSLFEPFTQRSLTLRNRLVVSPMCQYSARDGVPDDWHLVHLGSRAVGGYAVVFTEATAVSAQGRISLGDTGLWNDAQRDAWARIAAFVREHGALPGIQLAHAGRKASTQRPWEGGKPLAADAGAWTACAPSAIAFDRDWPAPSAMDGEAIARLIGDFRAAARRALEAGFRLVEIHAAHGYLLHEFLSPLSNRREDGYGGSLENRMRLVCEVVQAVRRVWPDDLPLWLRVSASDWAEGGWTVQDSVALARRVKPLGVDLVDASSGGLVPYAKIPAAPGYQVPFAAQIRTQAGIATGAVGLITEPDQAQAIVANGEADVVLMARESLRDPYFPRRAAQALEQNVTAPAPYQRAW